MRWKLCAFIYFIYLFIYMYFIFFSTNLTLGFLEDEVIIGYNNGTVERKKIQKIFLMVHDKWIPSLERQAYHGIR